MLRPTQYWVVDPTTLSSWRNPAMIGQRFRPSSSTGPMTMAIRPILAPQFPQVFPPPSSSVSTKNHSSKNKSSSGTGKIKQPQTSDTSCHSDDLSDLESMMNIDLSTLLPPNFGIDNDEEDHKNRSKKRSHDNGATSMDKKCEQNLSTKSKIKKFEKVMMENPDCYNIDGLIIDIHDEEMKRPPYSYSELIDFALREKGEMLVRDICRWISSNFDYYKRTEACKWQPSVRHTLTINVAFEKVKKVRGGHLWGLVSDKDYMRARQLKNHWKKQKLAEYEQTRFKRPHCDSDDESFTEGLSPHMETDREEMNLGEGDEGEMVMVDIPDDYTPSKRTGGRKSNRSTPGKPTPRSTPAKRCKRASPIVNEPEPEIVKTQTRHGRMACRIDYKEFAVRGMKRPVGLGDTKKKRKSKKGDTGEDIYHGCVSDIAEPLSPDYSSDDSEDEEDEFNQELFHGDTSEIKAGRVRQTGGSAMGTPELGGSQESNISNVSKMFETITANALREFDAACKNPGAVVATCAASTNVQSKRSFREHVETPTRVVISDLQDFEPTESAESILASTAALMSFPSTSEAALILSSLESSPRVDPLPNHIIISHAQLGQAISDNKPKECPENPIPVRKSTNTSLQKSAVCPNELDEGSIERFSNIEIKDVVEDLKESPTKPKTTHGGTPDHSYHRNCPVEIKEQDLSTSLNQNVIQPAPSVAVVEKSYCPSLAPNLSPRMMLPPGLIPAYPPGWVMMDGVHSPQQVTGVMDDIFPQYQVIHDVPLSDAWVKKPTNKPYQVPGQKGQARGARIPYNPRRYDMCSPAPVPVFLPGGRHMSPHTIHAPRVRHFSPLQYGYPRFHTMMAPSPIRPEQTMQAVIPGGTPRAISKPTSYIVSQASTSIEPITQQATYPSQNCLTSPATNTTGSSSIISNS